MRQSFIFLNTMALRMLQRDMFHIRSQELNAEYTSDAVVAPSLPYFQHC
jgi:hypothetical protein